MSQPTVTYASGNRVTVKNLQWLRHARSKVQVIILYKHGGMTAITDQGDVFRCDWSDFSQRSKYLHSHFKHLTPIESNHDYETWEELKVIPSRTMMVAFENADEAMVFLAMQPRLGVFRGIKVGEEGEGTILKHRWLLQFSTLKSAMDFHKMFVEIFNDMPVNTGISYIHLNDLPFVGLDAPDNIGFTYRSVVDGVRRNAGLAPIEWS